MFTLDAEGKRNGCTLCNEKDYKAKMPKSGLMDRAFGNHKVIFNDAIASDLRVVVILDPENTLFQTSNCDNFQKVLAQNNKWKSAIRVVHAAWKHHKKSLLPKLLVLFSTGIFGAAMSGLKADLDNESLRETLSQRVEDDRYEKERLILLKQLFQSNHKEEKVGKGRIKSEEKVDPPLRQRALMEPSFYSSSSSSSSSKKCRCGSTTHKRTNSKDCPLNKANILLNNKRKKKVGEVKL
jgi:hypothetical protein